MTVGKLIYLIITVIAICSLHPVQAQVDTMERIVPDRNNSASQMKKPYVLLISADGFRHDYSEKYQAKNLIALSSRGVKAKSMIPSYPSLTFPNHYTLVTGLYPSHHGLVNNHFLDEKRNERYSINSKKNVTDGKWYGGTPIWVVAEEQKLLTASLFWVGSEAEIKGHRPTYYYPYTTSLTVAERILIIKKWLSLPEEKRPHLITLYVSEPDHASHGFGPESMQTQKAVNMVDSLILGISEAIRPLNLPVNFIFVSDHGMTAVDRNQPIATPRLIDTAKYLISSSGTLMDIHAKNKADVIPLFTELKQSEAGFRTYLKSNMPANLHYSSTDDEMKRIGDILLLPEWPRIFSDRKPGPGYHGFDPYKVKDMHATFYAWGPAFKSGLIIPAFENIHVFPLITSILNLPFAGKIDGRAEVLKPILKSGK